MAYSTDYSEDYSVSVLRACVLFSIHQVEDTDSCYNNRARSSTGH